MSAPLPWDPDVLAGPFAHVVVDDSCFHDGHVARLLDDLQRCLAADFAVEHSTFQLEARSHAAHEHPTHP